MKVNKQELKKGLRENKEFEFFLSDNTSVYIVRTKNEKIFINEIFYHLEDDIHHYNYIKVFGEYNDIEEVIEFLEKEIYIEFI